MVGALNRRAWLKLAAGAGIALLVRPARGEDQKSVLQRKIPSSGEQIPAVGLGTSQVFDIGGGSEREAAKEVLRLFVENGGKLVDSSPMYGAAETVVGDLAAELGVQRKLFIATKVWTSGREAGIRQMEDSMRKLRTPRIDLMQVHNLLDLDTQLATLREWKKAGKVRYLGITHSRDSAHDELERIVNAGGIDFVQLNYSMTERAAEQRLLPMAAEKGTAVIVNRPFARANLFGRVRGKPLPDWAKDVDCASWAQFFLKYLLAHPAVTVVIPATRDPQHLVDNMAAGRGRLPDEALRKKMVSHLESL
jgi:aryl-alcohol dehydrogenase-like predicted oxidoreductase